MTAAQAESRAHSLAANGFRLSADQEEILADQRPVRAGGILAAATAHGQRGMVATARDARARTHGLPRRDRGARVRRQRGRLFHHRPHDADLRPLEPGDLALLRSARELCLNNIYRNGNDDIRPRYMPRICDGSAIGALGLTEPEAGSDALGSMGTTARR